MLTNKITDLPIEVLIEIATFLKAPSADIITFACVCHSFNRAINHSYVWKMFSYNALQANLVKKYKSIDQQKPSWKEFFKICYTPSTIEFEKNNVKLILKLNLKIRKYHFDIYKDGKLDENASFTLSTHTGILILHKAISSKDPNKMIGVLKNLGGSARITCKIIAEACDIEFSDEAYNIESNYRKDRKKLFLK
jgi:hypothetical protein